MNAVEAIVNMRADISRLYGEIAGKVRQAAGEEAGRLVADAERVHLDMFSHVVNGLSLMVQESHPMEVMKRIFDEKKLEMREAPEDAAESVRIGMEMEKKVVEFYRRASSETTVESERRLFDRLADAGRQQYDILANTYFFLENSESWYLWEEFGISDGGSEWA